MEADPPILLAFIRFSQSRVEKGKKPISVRVRAMTTRGREREGGVPIFDPLCTKGKTNDTTTTRSRPGLIAARSPSPPPPLPRFPLAVPLN